MDLGSKWIWSQNGLEINMDLESKWIWSQNGCEIKIPFGIKFHSGSKSHLGVKILSWGQISFGIKIPFEKVSIWIKIIFGSKFHFGSKIYFNKDLMLDQIQFQSHKNLVFLYFKPAWLPCKDGSLECIGL